MSSELPTDVSIKVLLLDDEVNITKALRRLLQDCGQYEVLTANAGSDALELIKENPDVGVIISDQRMPEMSGVEFLFMARQLVPDAVRILLTGHSDVQTSIGAINQGAVYHYLTKPWDDEELLQTVAAAAKNFWLIAENQRLNAVVEKQNAELQDWNRRLKHRVLDQTAQIRAKNEDLADKNQQLRGRFSDTIEALADLIEMRNRRAPGHCRNVAELVAAMASRLDLDQGQHEQIRSAALLHDIGKIGLSDRLLNTDPEDLVDEQFRTYQEHAVRGQAAIDRVPALRDIGRMIRHHHEQYDGHGFPDKLAGTDIPLGSRMICAADIFERMMLRHPKNQALDAALQDLVRHWGKTLDPDLQSVLEESAQATFSNLDMSADILSADVSPENLEIGMQLRRNLYSGTGILLLKQGTVFDQTAIDAVMRSYMIDPSERGIKVLMPQQQE